MIRARLSPPWKMNPLTRHGRIGVSLIVFLALAIPVAAVLGGLYVRWVKQPTEELGAQNQKTLMQMVGLGDPVSHRLDPSFSDADADLVADVPTDAKRQVDPATLIFCYIADDDPASNRDAWKPFTDHLSKVTGKPVEYALLANTKQQLRAMKDGKLHVAGFNTGSVPVAVNQCGFVPVCVLPTEDGSGLSRMRLIASAGSAIQSPADLSGHELTLTAPGSNSGYKAALVLLKSDFGLLPGRDFTLRYSGGHEQSIQGIAGGQFQVAAVSDDMLGRALTGGQIKKNQYRSIYESEKFPTAGLGYAHDLTPELAAKVRAALISFDWKGTALAERLASAGGTKFVPANYKNDWALIRRIDDASGQVQNVDEAESPVASGAELARATPSTQPATMPAAGQ